MTITHTTTWTYLLLRIRWLGLSREER
jgi:hypothetical protein